LLAAFRTPQHPVIADEAHSTKYDSVDGFARHMRDALPNASFIGFTAFSLSLSLL
jgi:type I restriction enzyme, R subunit